MIMLHKTFIRFYCSHFTNGKTEAIQDDVCVITKVLMTIFLCSKLNNLELF